MMDLPLPVGGELAAIAMMLLLWVGVILLIVWAVRGFAGPTASERSTSEQDRALAILEERFARGEIDLDEFRRDRDGLTNGRSI